MKDKNFLLEIKTPEKVIFEGVVTSLEAPSIIGSIGVLTGHTPLLAILKKGKLKFKHLEKEYVYHSGDGFIEILPDRVRILVEECK
jgi:F-type H+-transporting ATPase subunit epsilon